MCLWNHRNSKVLNKIDMCSYCNFFWWVRRNPRETVLYEIVDNLWKHALLLHTFSPAYFELSYYKSCTRKGYQNPNTELQLQDFHHKLNHHETHFNNFSFFFIVISFKRSKNISPQQYNDYSYIFQLDYKSCTRKLSKSKQCWYFYCKTFFYHKLNHPWNALPTLSHLYCLQSLLKLTVQFHL